MFALALLVAVAGCGGGGPGPTSSPVDSYEAYAAAACPAWDALFRAIGNPETAGWSEPHLALIEAVDAGDVDEADRLAGEITDELEAGRRHVAVAAGWPPAEATMTQLDRVFVAFEAMVEARRTAASSAAGGPDPQAAFEAAGGVEAWFAMFEAARAHQPPAGAAQCPTVPVTP